MSCKGTLSSFDATQMQELMQTRDPQKLHAQANKLIQALSDNAEELEGADMSIVGCFFAASAFAEARAAYLLLERIEKSLKPRK